MSMRTRLDRLEGGAGKRCAVCGLSLAPGEQADIHLIWSDEKVAYPESAGPENCPSCGRTLNTRLPAPRIERLRAVPARELEAPRIPREVLDPTGHLQGRGRTSEDAHGGPCEATHREGLGIPRNLAPVVMGHRITVLSFYAVGVASLPGCCTVAAQRPRRASGAPPCTLGFTLR